jgi:aryl-alcohol dehydrogenase-like predicted oxidoreductase
MPRKPHRKLGETAVFPIGFGCMPLSVPGRPDEAQAIRTIHAALDAGVNLLDTADAYSDGEEDVGRGERLIARALRDVPAAERPLVATKAGHTRPGGRWELDGRPEYLRGACEASLRALETDTIDLLQLHRPDPATPFAESVGALAELLEEGKIRHVGLSNVTVAQLEEAEAIVEVAAVQNELSLEYVEPLRNGEVAACAERGIPLLAWSPLGGASGAADAGSSAPAVGRIAAERDVSPQRVALAWLLSLSPTVLPIPGSRRPETILDSVAAVDLQLSGEEIAAIGRDIGVTSAL